VLWEGWKAIGYMGAGLKASPTLNKGGACIGFYKTYPFDFL
jgi:hypothetical protein